MTRTDRITAPADYETRLSIWQAAVDAAAKQIKFAGILQSQGTGFLRDGNSQGAQIIEKGIAIEREAHQELMELYERKPRQ